VLLGFLVINGFEKPSSSGLVPDSFGFSFPPSSFSSKEMMPSL
jgi:hypothetical protein